MSKQIAIIGAGTGGLAAACLLAKAGHNVTVYEKNEQPGGRNSIFQASGFTFNYGPSWYLMPDVFGHFFSLLGEDIGTHLSLQRLSPSYRVFFENTLLGATDIYGDFERDGATFESFEPGSRIRLKHYLQRAEQIHKLASENFLYKNYDSWRDLAVPGITKQGLKLNMLRSLHQHVADQFKSHELQKILEYPAVFLGGSPYNIPALYSLLSHVDFNQGVFYPKGGLYALTEALAGIAKSYGARIACKSEAVKILTSSGHATGIKLVSGEEISVDTIISGAGVQNTEQNLLEHGDRMYSSRYWRRQVAAPSALLIHLGISGELPELRHHNLFFSKNWNTHFDSIYKKRAWPNNPSMYICNPSKTDAGTAPAGHENLTILVPIAAGLGYSDDNLETYADHILQAIEQTLHIGDLRQRIVYKRLFCTKDFEQRYHAPKGTALGLAHTLKQSAAFRPKNIHEKINNLYFVGADTVPGIGLPMCLISAELVCKRLEKHVLKR